jgi:LacI family transcriptional regulator
MATLVDVARLAGCSISTVSHVVNGTRHVEPETRNRVMSAIAETGYKQDAVARALRRSQSESIGLVVSDAGQPAFAEMVHGVEQEATRRGLTLLLASSGEDPTRELKAVRALLERRVDGMILARTSHSSDEVLSELARAAKPVVLIDRLFDLDIDQVGVENHKPMEQLVADLAAKGHRRIGLVAGDLDVPTLRERHEGFVRGVEKAGLELSDQPVCVGAVVEAEARKQVATVLSAEHPPTALIAASTVLAAGSLYAVQDACLAIPGDLAFATFDGFAYADLFQPPLTTIRQPAFEVGSQAMRLLVERMRKPKGRRKTIRLDAVIESRASTATSLTN